MKDGTPDAHSSELPSCSLSTHCARLLDELDEDREAFQNDLLLFEESAQERQLLEQLRTHVPDCSTCTSTLIEERAIRVQQREMLRQLLAGGEQKVPSTSARIMQAISDERRASQEKRANGHVTSAEIEALSTQPLTRSQPSVLPERRSRVLLRGVFAFAAVLALILASVSLFSRVLPSHLSASRSTSGNGVPNHAPDSVLHSPDWSSILMTEMSGGQKIIASIDPLTSKRVILASSQYPDNTVVDGVSHDGYKVLYHVFDGTSTRYYVQPANENETLYTLNGKGNQALWSTDDHYLFISTSEGIKKVDAANRAVTLVLPSFKMADLLYYRDGYLYFVQSDSSSTALGRVNLATGNVVPITAAWCASGYGFWLSPGGITVYYHCKDHSDLYATNSDGTNARSLRQSVGDAIGYADQGQLLTLLKANNVYQVIQLGTDIQHDQVVVANVAPGASHLTADDVIVRPYGQTLVALAHYSNGSSDMWYSDLLSHEQHKIPASSDTKNAGNMQLIGWDKLSIP